MAWLPHYDIGCLFERKKIMPILRNPRKPPHFHVKKM
jgi:hypothetical protein